MLLDGGMRAVFAVLRIRWLCLGFLGSAVAEACKIDRKYPLGDSARDWKEKYVSPFEWGTDGAKATFCILQSQSRILLSCLSGQVRRYLGSTITKVA